MIAMFRNLNPRTILGIKNLKFRYDIICRLAREAKFDGIDIDPLFLDDNSVENAKKSIFKYRLRVGGWSLPAKWRTRSDSEFDQIKDKISRAAAIASRLSCFRAYTWIEPFSDDMNYNTNFQWHIERLREVARILMKESCLLGLEYVAPMTARVGHPFIFIHTMKEMIELIGEMKMKNVGLLLDSFHWYAAKENRRDILELDKKQIIYVHINDAPNVPIDELRDDERCLPGETGVIDIDGFFYGLRELEYDGPITPETFNSGSVDMGMSDAIFTAGKALYKVWPRN